MQKNNTSIFYSSNNILTCTVNDILLHSKYNPVKEAQRNILAQSQKHKHTYENIKLVICLGSALGYEIDAIQHFYCNAQVVPVFYDKTLYKQSKHSHKILYEKSSFTQEIQKYTKNYNVQSIAILHWQASLKIWAQEINNTLKNIKDVLFLSFSEKNTGSYFMRQWIINSALHYLHIDSANIPSYNIAKEVIVIAAGSSLNYHLQQIKNYRKHYIIICVSSALMCVLEHDIIPDIVVHQDSSYYSAKHLFPLHATSDNVLKQTKIAIPFNTSRHSLLHNSKNKNIILLNTGQEIEGLLDCTTEPCVHINAYATVMGSAIELAWKISSSNVFIIGFDLSVDIMGAHCNPHISNNMNELGHRTNSFENILHEQYRTMPHILKIKRHSMPVKQNYALQTYEKWFSNWSNINKKRSYILQAPNNEYLDMGFIPCTKLNANSCTSAEIEYKHVIRLTYKERKNILREKVYTWSRAFENIEKQKSIPEKENIISSLVRSTFCLLPKEAAHATFEQLHDLLNN